MLYAICICENIWYTLMLCYIYVSYIWYNINDTKGKIFWKVLLNYKHSLLSKHIGSKQKIFTDWTTPITGKSLVQSQRPCLGILVPSGTGFSGPEYPCPLDCNLKAFRWTSHQWHHLLVASSPIFCLTVPGRDVWNLGLAVPPALLKYYYWLTGLPWWLSW